MVKRDQGEPTADLSASQVLAVTPKPPTPPVSKHDASVWKGLVVGADDFAPAAKAKPKMRRWMIYGVLGSAVVAGSGYAVLTTRSDKPKTPAIAKPSDPVAPTPAPTEAVAKPATPEGSATQPAPAPAKVETPAPAASEPDAITSAAPPTKKQATKKAPAIKKPATKAGTPTKKRAH